MNKNKVLVQLCIPVTGVSFDFLLPRTLSVIQATQLISGFFTGMTGGAYMPDGKMYNVNSSVEELHLKNGSKLMLI